MMDENVRLGLTSSSGTRSADKGTLEKSPGRDREVDGVVPGEST